MFGFAPSDPIVGSALAGLDLYCSILMPYANILPQRDRQDLRFTAIVAWAKRCLLKSFDAIIHRS
jgi:hypothetical protein